MIARGLARYVGRGAATERGAMTACEICAAPLGEPHAHLVDLQARRLCCACQACALLFARERAGAGHEKVHYRTVPDRVLVDPERALSESDWDGLQIPVRLAFVLFDSAAGRWAAFYPSPAGATESELSLGAWSELATRFPLLRAAAPDTEALLFHGRRPGAPFRTFLVPIDVCYRLVALVRSSFRGLGGGEVHAAVERFLDDLERRSRPLRRAGGAA